VKELYASYVSRPEVKAAAAAAAPLSTHFRLTVEGKSYDITCEEIS